MLSQNIKKFIIRIFSSLPDNILKKFEKIFSISRGKGFNFSIDSEFKNVLMIQKQINIFVDVGSNKGEYTNTVLTHFPNAKCYLFEPSITNFQILKKRFTQNNIKIINKALSDSEQSTFLYYNKKGSGQSSLYKRKLNNLNLNKKEKIKTLKMSNYFNKNINSIVDLCKIDVEGNELKVLKGLNFDKFLPKLIIVEYLDINSQKWEIPFNNIENIMKSEIYNFIISKNYKFVNWVNGDLVFVSKKFKV